jgi:hypothetical protein
LDAAENLLREIERLERHESENAGRLRQKQERRLSHFSLADARRLVSRKEKKKTERPEALRLELKNGP